jgi:thiamine transport system ATP-binding protein
MLILDQVKFSYISNDFSFSLTLDEGKILGIVGPSGSGKSTLLNLIAGFILPISGKITYSGADITTLPPKARPVTISFQQNNLFNHLTVFDNVALGIDPDLNLSPEQIIAVNNVIEMVELRNFNLRPAFELSGGEAQRVSIARAIIRNKPILLFDEPFAALDPYLKNEMIILIKRLHIESGFTIIVVSHNPEDCLKLCDEVAFIDQGSIYKRGNSISMLKNPTDMKLRKYLGLDIMQNQ